MSRMICPSCEELANDFNWRTHTTRQVAGALKKKLGLNVVSEKADGGSRSAKSDLHMTVLALTEP